jgi:hypothetical protein
MFQTKAVEEIKTHFMLSKSPPPNSRVIYCLWRCPKCRVQGNREKLISFLHKINCAYPPIAGEPANLFTAVQYIGHTLVNIANVMQYVKLLTVRVHAVKAYGYVAL